MLCQVARGTQGAYRITYCLEVLSDCRYRPGVGRWRREPFGVVQHVSPVERSTRARPILCVVLALVCTVACSNTATTARPSKHEPSPTVFVPPELQLTQSLTFAGGESGDMRSGRVRPVCAPLGPVTTQPQEWATSISGLVLGGHDIPWLLDIHIRPFVGAGEYMLDVDTPAGARLFPSSPNEEYFDAMQGELSIDRDGLGGTIDSEFVSDGPTPGDGALRTAAIHVMGNFVCGSRG